jgi:hypothetical protein
MTPDKSAVARGFVELLDSGDTEAACARFGHDQARTSPGVAMSAG